MGRDELDRLRAIALGLPEVNERRSHGVPCFFVRDKRPLCYYHDRRGNDRITLWCPAPPGVPDALVATEPERFFEPSTSASGVFAGWLGVYLDGTDENAVQWDEIAAILQDAFRTVAPKVLIARLDNR